MIKNYITITLLTSIAVAGSFSFAHAQEHDLGNEIVAQEEAAQELIELDENITPEDLGVNDPAILPNNPLYVFKGITRGVQSLFTRDPVKKAELKLKFANEKIIEAKKMEERGAGDNTIRSAVESYERDVEEARKHIDRALEGNREDVGQVVDRVVDSQIKHHTLLGKFEREREGVAPEIEKAKQEAMRHFTESAAAALDPEELRRKFEDALASQKGSVFRHFKHVEVLEEVKDLVPAEAREGIQRAIENSSKFFEEEFARAEDDQRKLFDKYLERTGGNEVRHLEAFDSINSFADIRGEFFADIEKAREKARGRVEKRMKTIEDETRKQVFVAHLEDADLENARIVKELENNLSPETISAVLDIKRKADQKLRERFEQAESSGDLDSFFKEIEGSPDVQMLEIMKEMETIIPNDKRNFWEEMKRKAISEMQEDIQEAERFGQLEDKYRQIAGSDPEHFAILDDFQGEFGDEFGFFEDVRREQAERIQERFGHFQEFSAERPDQEDFFRRGEEFRLRIQEDPSRQSEIERFAPKIRQEFEQFDVQRENIGISEEEVREKIAEAGKLVRKLADRLATVRDGQLGKEAARQLYINAGEQIAASQDALDHNRKGEAFGQATSAIRTANNGLRKLEQEEFKAEREDYFEERDEFRLKFDDLPKEERPDPNEFLQFNPQKFFDESPSRREDIDKSEDARARDQICGQALTPARHAETRECVVFPNTCLPPNWHRDGSCEDVNRVDVDQNNEPQIIERPQETFEIPPPPAEIPSPEDFFRVPDITPEEAFRSPPPPDADTSSTGGALQ